MVQPADPFERGEVLGHRFVMPPSLVPAKFELIGEFHSAKAENQQTFTIARFLENTDVPGIVARWLQYRSFTDNRVMTLTADDRYRFGNVNATRKHFLRDQNGRRLYAAIDKDPTPCDKGGRMVRKLAGAIWLHPLEGGPTGDPILRACDAFNKKQEQQEAPERMIDPSRLATLASRIYSENRGTGMHTPLLVNALEDYFDAWESCDGVAIRMSVGDATALSAFQNGSRVKDLVPFEPICVEDGVAFLLHRRHPIEVEVSAESLEAPYNAGAAVTN